MEGGLKPSDHPPNLSQAVNREVDQKWSIWGSNQHPNMMPTQEVWISMLQHHTNHREIFFMRNAWKSILTQDDRASSPIYSLFFSRFCYKDNKVLAECLNSYNAETRKGPQQVRDPIHILEDRKQVDKLLNDETEWRKLSLRYTEAASKYRAFPLYHTHTQSYSCWCHKLEFSLAPL